MRKGGTLAPPFQLKKPIYMYPVQIKLAERRTYEEKSNRVFSGHALECKDT